jgi:hypothetical protein
MDCMHEVWSRITTAAGMAAITESSIDSSGDLGVRDKSYLLRQTAIFVRAGRECAGAAGDDSGCQLDGCDRR